MFITNLNNTTTKPLNQNKMSKKLHNILAVLFGILTFVFLYTDKKDSMFMALGLCLYSEIRAHLCKIEDKIKSE